MRIYMIVGELGEGADAYEVLEVSPTASDSEIKKAFRAKSRTLHPDLYKGNDRDKAEAEFNQVRYNSRFSMASIYNSTDLLPSLSIKK
jgi:DnaJ-domain-containing protein 1